MGLAPGRRRRAGRRRGRLDARRRARPHPQRPPNGPGRRHPGDPTAAGHPRLLLSQPWGWAGWARDRACPERPGGPRVWGYGALPSVGKRPAEAAHPAPRSGRTPVLRGAHGRGRLLVGLLAALPPGHPAAVSASRTWDVGDYATTPNHPLLPRHLQPHRLFPERSWVGSTGPGTPAAPGQQGRPAALCRRRRGEPVVPQRHRRRVRLCRARCRPGRDRLRRARPPPRDYLVMPRATTHRWLPVAEGDAAYSEPLRLVVVEASSHVSPPRRYLSRYGQLLEHAPTASVTCACPSAHCSPRTSARTRRGDRGAHQAPRVRAGRDRRDGARPAAPPARCRVGRLPVPVRLRYRRLRADHRRCTSRRPPTRCSRAPGSSSATSCRARSTTTRWRSRCRTTTRMSTPTR